MSDRTTYYFKEALAYYMGQKKNRTQQWLAKKTGISQQSISRILSGKSLGREKNRIVISQIFCDDYLEFLTKGREILNSKSGVSRITQAKKEHHRVIDEFPNPEEAVDFNKVLVKIAKKDTTVFDRLHKQAKFELSLLNQETDQKIDKENSQQASGE